MVDLSSVEERARAITLLLMDCDGVLTDGRIWILNDQDDQKAFHTRDGLGLELWHRAGHKSGIISGRPSTAVARRAQGLGISFVCLGRTDKRAAFEDVLKTAEVASEQVAFIGDDLNDLPLMSRSGLALAVSDASKDVKAQAHYITEAAGGRGAVREVIELILKSQQRWSALASEFLK